MRFHRGPLVQRGRGIGSFFRSIWNFAKPVLTRLSRSSLVQEVGKSAASSAAAGGLKAVADALDGKKSLKAGLGEGVEVAKGQIAEVLRKRSGGGGGKRQSGAGFAEADSDGDTDEGGVEELPQKRGRKKATAGKRTKKTQTGAGRRGGNGGRTSRRPRYGAQSLFDDSPGEEDDHHNNNGVSSDSED
jgi:hypothetical protein